MTDPPTPTASRAKRFRSAPSSLRPTVLKFVLGGLLPACAGIWLVLLGPEGRGRVFSSLPDGAPGRIAHAAIAVGVVVILSWFTLPIVHGAEVGCRIATRWFRDRHAIARVLLSPFEAVAVTLWYASTVLFYVNAALIVACALLALLFAVWIPAPGLLGGEEALFRRLPM